ncbi:MAG: hypothetical protein ACRD04_01565 [Terriglobales bacterium]
MSRYFLALWLPHLSWQALRGNAEERMVVASAEWQPEVLAASPAARRLGISAGSSLAQARLRAPGCAVVARSSAAEARLRTALEAELETISDRCHALPPERWLVDLRGMESCLGPAPEIARRLAARLQAEGLEARLGVGPSRTAALLGAQASLAPMLAPEAAPVLAPLPLEMLIVLADGMAEIAACVDLFRRWGLRTLGEVAALPRRALTERLGRAGLHCRHWARGQDQGLLLPPPPSLEPARCQQAFEPALEGYVPLLPWLEQSLRQQAAAWERHDRALAVCELKLELTEKRNWSWRYAPPLPHRDARRCLRQLETALALQPPPALIAAAVLELRLLRPRHLQAGLFGDAAVEEENRERLLGQLRVLLGDPEGWRCGSPRLRDLHREDLFVMAPFQPEEQGKKLPVASCRLPVLRVHRPALEIRLQLKRLPVQGDGFNPVGAVCTGPKLHARRVRQAWGPWRSSGAWWSEAAWSHDEWEVEFASGERSRLRHDRRARRWFLLGEYD